jgi:rhamnulokinase
VPVSSLLAIDLGASSGRLILGRVGPRTLELRQLSRFRNGPVRLPDGLYWDVLGLYQDVLAGLRSATGAGDDLVGVAVDSWAVDYGLLDQAGSLLANPMHYRDGRNAAGVESVHRRIDAARLYQLSGVAHQPFNTVFQLAADTDRLERAQRLLLVPDLIGYWLSGAELGEQTNASTTGLLDTQTRNWSATLLSELAIPGGLLPPVVPAGEVIGGLRDGVRAGTGLGAGVRLSTVASHDTASAVVGVPAQDDRFAFISCGTWGLVGVELEAPVLSQQSQQANFSNELGVDGTVRYLRNVMGLWLLQESMRSWALQGIRVELAELVARAGLLPPGGPVIDADSAAFLAPDDMPARIVQACARTGQRVPRSQAEITRCILDSLAIALGRGVRDACRLSGREIDVVHLVGGGAQNALLCQLTADAVGLPVIAGPVEATAIGNLLVQARTHGAISGDLADLRALIRATSELRSYQPSTGRLAAQLT